MRCGVMKNCELLRFGLNRRGRRLRNIDARIVHLMHRLEMTRCEF
jgi:hypothetical protein